MADFMDKMQVNSAITNNTKLDLGHQHVTTGDFMQLNVAWTRELVPGEKIDVNMESFARLNPMPVPTFGRASMRNRAFFVPYRTIFRGWNDFITDTPHVNSMTGDNNAAVILSHVPTISNLAFITFFMRDAEEVEWPAEIDPELYNSDKYTIHYINAQGTNASYDLIIDTQAYVLTNKGRQALKMIESLGYKIAWQTKYVATYSALPLLALAKVYVDWYFPNQYHDLLSYDRIMSMCNYDSTGSIHDVSAYDLKYIFDTIMYVQYDADFLVSAWDNPVSPSTGEFSTFTFTDVTGKNTSNLYASAVTNSGGTAVNAFNTPAIMGYNSTNDNPAPTATLHYNTQYVHDTLKALTDYMRRHQMVGSRAFDRYLARFGKALSAEKMNRSVYLGAAMQDLQIGDVMSTADTEGANLGAYAGKGLSYGNGHFEYNTDEFGIFIILSSIVPNVGYFQGINASQAVKRVSKTDFYTPEFDALGVEAVAADEVFVPNHRNYSVDGIGEQVFGFLPRYYSYKIAQDNVTGNFRVNSINGSSPQDTEFNAADSWYLMRVFDVEDFPSVADIHHSKAFMEGTDHLQYKRLFYNTDVDAPDNFTIIHNFEAVSYFPGKSLFDTYEFDDKGKKVTEEVNGVKMN